METGLLNDCPEPFAVGGRHDASREGLPPASSTGGGIHLKMANALSCCRRKSRSQVTSSFTTVGPHFRLGTFFAFVAPTIFTDEAYAWLRHCPELRLPASGCVLPIYGPERLRLPQVDLTPRLAELQLGTVTCDRDLYRQNRDVVRLLVVDPLRPERDVEVELCLHGSVLQRITTRLDGNGAGCLEVHDLTSGEYQVRLKDQPQATSFTVAEYRLAPLVGFLVAHQRHQGTLQVTLRVESFGRPVEGPLRVELMDAGRRVSSHQGQAVEGMLRTELVLTGEGPFSLNLQRQSHSATVALLGTRRAERELTLFSTLGNEVQGSLVPESGSLEVRGLHLVEGAARNAPVRLERIDARRARVTATARCEGLRAMVVDPAEKRPQGRPTPPSLDDSPDYWLGLSQFQQGAFERAALLFAQAFARQPDSWVAHYMARALAGAGHFDASHTWLARAREMGWRLSEEELAQVADLRGQREIYRDVLEPGQSFELDVPAPLGLLAVGCYVQGRAFEGWAAVVPACELSANLATPEAARPEEEVELTVEAPAGASVYMLVRDARLSRQDTPETSLANRLKTCVASLPPRLETVRPNRVSESARAGLLSRATAALAGRPMVRGASRAGLVRPEFRGSGGMLGERPVLGPSSSFPPAMDFAAASPSMPASMDFGDPTFGSLPPARGFGFSGPVEERSASFGGSHFGAPEPFAADLLGEAPSAVEETEPLSAPPPEATSHEAEVLLAELGRGSLSKRLKLPNTMGELVVEAFVIHGKDWRWLRRRLRVVADEHLEIEAPPCVFPGDQVTGKLLLVGHARVTLTRDGEPVELGPDLTFPVQPGLYRAQAGQLTAECRVDPPGKLRRRMRSLRLLRAGESVSLSPEVLSWRLLPNCDQPLETLAEATTDYSYCCCEQTSARMVAAATMLELARTPERRLKAEAALRAGLQRLESMWMDRRGFRIYPEQSTVHAYWSEMAAMNLRALRHLYPDSRVEALDNRVRQVYPGLEKTGLAGVYWSLPQHQEEAARQARAFLAEDRGSDRVAWRTQAAFAVAILVRCRELESVLSTVNSITADLNEQGRLYSTCDSLAALAMFRELTASGLLNGQARTEATEETLRVVEGLATVEVDRLVTEDWSELSFAVPLRIWWTPRQLRVGEAVDLHVQLQEGYEMGDLVYLNLPACLTRVVGGGQVKELAVDFAGASQVTIPLVATAAGTQHFTLCVRNMYREDRAGSPGLLRVEVAPA